MESNVKLRKMILKIVCYYFDGRMTVNDINSADNLLDEKSYKKC